MSAEFSESSVSPSEKRSPEQPDIDSIPKEIIVQIKTPGPNSVPDPPSFPTLRSSLSNEDRGEKRKYLPLLEERTASRNEIQKKYLPLLKERKEPSTDSSDESFSSGASPEEFWAINFQKSMNTPHQVEFLKKRRIEQIDFGYRPTIDPQADLFSGHLSV
jgi:hypothetical protein